MALENIHDLCVKNVIQEIEKFCRNCETKYKISGLFSLYNGIDTKQEKKEESLEIKYGHKTIILNEIIFLKTEEREEVFCKIVNDDAVPLTHEDEVLCRQFNQRVVEGLF
ncbi:hypothetical protein IIV31_144R [Armadillidium vulgare iridescent virus]|uniref:Uncharacterized protein n=1 Tax=Armadillidium vulgare iridescent virus TaxID=72201 RepID=A0A068QKL7_9VIRU|nr:hypothetical protein IIV31_144R [Armadillidium vulgare iridescent virus]CCV02516.1 hypothetical protein IIV31_144R [Armadillidium vulgare iridescent virus]